MKFIFLFLLLIPQDFSYGFINKSRDKKKALKISLHTLVTDLKTSSDIHSDFEKIKSKFLKQWYAQGISALKDSSTELIDNYGSLDQDLTLALKFFELQKFLDSQCKSVYQMDGFKHSKQLKLLFSQANSAIVNHQEKLIKDSLEYFIDLVIGENDFEERFSKFDDLDQLAAEKSKVDFYFDRLYEDLSLLLIEELPDSNKEGARQLAKLKLSTEKNIEAAYKNSRISLNPATEAYLKYIEENNVRTLPNLHSYSFTASSNAQPKKLLREMKDFSKNAPKNFDAPILMVLNESKLNQGKFLIVGPAKTPYENGLFIFDWMVDHDYPTKPPKIAFKPRGTNFNPKSTLGYNAFNPNLYNDGKVCLSLLGTYGTSSWERKSSMLQVVVSIQGLVLVENPINNEPSLDYSLSHAKAKEFNKYVSRGNVEYAMLSYLKQADPDFADFIKIHFWAKYQQIMEMIANWDLSEKLRSEISEALRKNYEETQASLNEAA